jgi:tRNA-(ms[2]io[6]A)-hydroxylase
VLNLASVSDSAWLDRALAGLDEVLLDHAHAEKKAASTALSLVFRYPERPELARPLSELAREELRHFEAVLGQLDRRGLRFRRQRPSPYAGRLQEAVRAHEPARLVDTLLCCALIEARSCERFQLLAAAMDDSVLAEFYEALLAAEARHHGLYVELARGVDPDAPDRLKQLAIYEAKVLAEAPPWPRLHT